ncbi:DNA polymerase III subunit delta [Cytophagales bacterium WSM2-2]|nr:DNA polymerase III subunit delta [Cytophagales bacterium WSM2-2]
MTFAAIPGLEETKHRLTASVRSNHIAHALLFAGKPGALNLPLALAFANYLHCTDKKENDACGNCPACSKSQKYIHPDTHFVFPLGNVSNDKDEDRFRAEILKTWRSFLLEKPFGNLAQWMASYEGEDKQALIAREESRKIVQTLSLKPFESTNKIMIIWLPELMHSSAANGILKILEEPPPQTFFLLVTNGAEQLLPTILSRTQIVHVPQLSDSEIENYLKKNFSLEEAQVNEILQMADGDLNFAIQMTDEEEDHHHQHRFTDWMRSCFKKDYVKLLGLADEFHELDKLAQRNLFHYALGMMREALIQISSANAISRAKGPEEKFIKDFSKVFSVPKIETFNKLINEATYHLERNGSAKMIFMDLSLQLSKTINP